MAYKPSDFFLGVMEFLAILLPGVMLTFVLSGYQGLVFNRTFLPPLHSEQVWIAFFVVSYILGHLLHAVGGALLDPFLYDKIYARYKRIGGEELSLRRTRGIMRADLGKGSKEISAYLYAWSYVSINSAAARLELEMGSAESKFFRSLSLVLVVLMFEKGACTTLGEALFFVATFALVIYRYLSLRWKNVQRTYEYFIILRLQPAQNEKKQKGSK